uniref:Retrovirus-related Pol polyprotein from transposon TNT 1-94 n=1 Tax=Tanacetum cinerariifolium TaxID=118510 RepID=A0A6L2KLI2_TANCI|nr:hypothetical protein [Tanacetum cinerariifolium]
MLDSKAYKEYYAVASGAKPPKAKTKYKEKADESITSYKSKTTSASEGTGLKSKAKMDKPNKKKQPTKKTKAKGLVVLSEVALTEPERIKLITKRSKTDFHISQASSSDDGVDFQSKVPDKQQQKTSSTDKGTGTIPGVTDVPTYEYDHDDNDDDDQTEYKEEDVDEGVHTPSGDEFNEEEKLDDEETMDDEEDDEVLKELYKDVNVNLEKGFEQEKEDAHVTLTLVSDAQKADEPVQSYSVSSKFTSKFLNLKNPSLADNEIASLMETSAPYATIIPKITSGFTITTPLSPSFFNPPMQQQTPTIPTPNFTTITLTYLTVALPEISNLLFVFKFYQRVSALESKLSELKQTNQFVEAVSSILSIVDMYLASKIKEVINVAIQLQTNKLKKEAQAKNQDFLNHVDSTMKKIINDQVKEHISKMMPKIEKSDTQKNVYNALVESYNSNKDIITSYGDVVLLKRGRYDQDKDEDPSTGSDQGMKRRKSEESSHTVEESGMQQDQEFVTGDNDEQPIDKEVTKADWFKKPKRPPTPDLDWNLEYLKGGESCRRYSTSVTKTKAATYELKWIEDLVPKLWSPVVYDLNVALRMFTKCIVIQKRVDDLQLGVKSYQKKLNLTKPDTYRSNLMNKSAYTSHSDPYGILYVDSFERKRLMRFNELHKFSDGTLNDVRTALYDIAAGIRMEYLPMRKWSNLDKKQARVMVQEIDKQLYQRRLMRNLKKFVGGRPYGEDLRLLERTI